MMGGMGGDQPKSRKRGVGELNNENLLKLTQAVNAGVQRLVSGDKEDEPLLPCSNLSSVYWGSSLECTVMKKNLRRSSAEGLLHGLKINGYSTGQVVWA
jgi:hypothetical protein